MLKIFWTFCQSQESGFAFSAKINTPVKNVINRVMLILSRSENFDGPKLSNSGVLAQFRIILPAIINTPAQESNFDFLLGSTFSNIIHIIKARIEETAKMVTNQNKSDFILSPKVIVIVPSNLKFQWFRS